MNKRYPQNEIERAAWHRKVDRLLFMARKPFGLEGCWDCHLTPQAGADHGYCNAEFFGFRIGVHRAVWIDLYGPIPSTVFVRHTCDNRRCINPLHLLARPPRANVEDRGRHAKAYTAIAWGVGVSHEMMNSRERRLFS